MYARIAVSLSHGDCGLLEPDNSSVKCASPLGAEPTDCSLRWGRRCQAGRDRSCISTNRNKTFSIPVRTFPFFPCLVQSRVGRLAQGRIHSESLSSARCENSPKL